MKTIVISSVLMSLCAGALAAPPASSPVRPLETVATFSGPMPTGVTVSQSGRIFVNFPRWGDPVTYSVAEVKNGKTVPFPDTALNRYDPAHPADTLVSVQSVVVDPKDRLWILDTGSIKFGPVSYGGPKLIGVDLKSGQVFKKILFSQDVALPTSYLNDVRFDLNRGKAGMAFITDSSDKGPNGIVVVDLDSGESWRRLNDHPSTKAEPHFVPKVEGQPLMHRKPGQPPQPIKNGSDGIAIDTEAKKLYYSPLGGRHVFSVNLDMLAGRNHSETEVAATVADEGDKIGASDGLIMDAQGNLYTTDYEHRAIRRRHAPGTTFNVLVSDPRIVWPDTLSIANGYLYFTNNQLNRQADYHNGRDLRVKPYTLFRVRIDTRSAAARGARAQPSVR